MVSVITINYNSYNDTCEFVDSLIANETYPHEVIIVDNASRAEEGQRLQARYPDCTVVCSPKNLGFSGGNNEGYWYAKGAHILYMNNDMIVEKPFLGSLVDRLNSSDRIGAVSPKIRYSHHPDVIQYAGYTPMAPITIRNNLIGVNEKDTGQYDVASETAFIHGACVLTSREILEKAGCMTEVYFLFYEELDWSLQLQGQGYAVWYEPLSVVYHKESMTIKRGSPLRLYYLTRSRLLFARRNYVGRERLLACLYQICLVLPRNLLSFLLKGQWGMMVASWKGTERGVMDKKED